MEYSKISSSLWMYTIPKVLSISGVHLLRGKGIIPMEGVIAVVKAGDFLYTLANPLPPQSDVIMDSALCEIFMYFRVTHSALFQLFLAPQGFSGPTLRKDSEMQKSCQKIDV